jgi:hypothetical protein
MSDPTGASTSFISILVAAGAVVVSLISVIMQFVTLRGVRQNLVSSLRVGAAEHEIEKLRDTLSEYMLVEYNVETAYKDAMSHNKPYPGDNYEMVERETRLWHSIRLHLRTDSDAHRQLLTALEALRNDTNSTWVDRSDRVIEKANIAFAFQRSAALG